MSQSDVKIIKANKNLKEKVGTGDIAATRVEASQNMIENNEVDFEPMAAEFLDALADGVKHCQGTAGEERTAALQSMVKPVMDLKANAQMFGYPLVTELANIMLNFLESVETPDNDVIAIVDAHRKTLMLIIKSKMSGPIGQKGMVLIDELKKACARYYAKKDIEEKPTQ